MDAEGDPEVPSACAHGPEGAKSVTDGAGIERLSLDELRSILAKLGADIDAHFRELDR